MLMSPRSTLSVKYTLHLLIIIWTILLSKCFALNVPAYDKKQTGKLTESRFTLSFNYDKYIPSTETTADYWHDVAQKEILTRLGLQKMHLHKAKNIIFFIGDGMSLSSVTAARIHKGQLHGKLGEETSLTFEKFPNVALSKTYCTNTQVADSACSATAYLCGVKANIQTTGVTAKVRFNNCHDSSNPVNHVSSIAAWAQAAGKSTGFVTTTRVTHATPSALYAHSANRIWESDKDIRKTLTDEDIISHCPDIAQQLITSRVGKNFNVIMGGGMKKFLPNDTIDAHGHRGERLDGQNLLQQWQTDHPDGIIVTNRWELENSLEMKNFTHIMGLFAASHLNYYSHANHHKEPTISQMTAAAIKILQRNKNGFFLFVEGGLIDLAHHETKAGLSIDEIIQMDEAVDTALTYTEPNDTLIVVSADHGHPLTIAGYPGRGTSITNLNVRSGDRNGVPYMTLNYPVGPKQYLDEIGERQDLSKVQITKDFIYPSQITNDYGVHSGEDVGVFAYGPQSQLFSGVMEQNAIPHIMAYAACIGDGLTMCNNYEGKSHRSPKRSHFSKMRDFLYLN